MSKAVRVLVIVVAVAAVVARFLIRSPMWLDEALTVNIAKGSVAQIADHLHRDGHPPLYYVLLHGWMGVFGEGDRAVRALSGVISLACLPLIWAAGKRVGGTRVAECSVVALALSPFFLRYGSEARMYSLVMVEVLVGFLLVSDVIDGRPTWWRYVGIALVTSALLWTHYWSFWLIGAAGVLLVVHWWRHRGEATSWWRTPAVGVLASAAVGALTFLPWLPTLLYQSAHTGTPWAKSFRPTTLVFTSLVDFAGGPYSEPQILMLALVLLMFIGLTAVALDASRLEIDLHTRPDTRRVMWVVAGTIAIASLAGLATGMAFAPRYASFYFPFVMIIVGLGLSRFLPGRAHDVVWIVVVVLSLAGLAVVFRLQRSQAGEVADAISARASSGLVVACPDQLGPSLSRALDKTGNHYDVRSYPRLDSPRFVDWVDYAERNARNDPAVIAKQVAAEAGDRPLFVVFRDDFETLKGQCASLVVNLGATRPSKQLVTGDGDGYYEPMSVIQFDQPVPPGR